ncbi:MAG: zf-HC2 domain-containing protein [Verrucomicrobiia bacterium]
MKPCPQNRKLIVWLALNALDARQTRDLRAHLETCEGCRGYLDEISNVTEALATEEANPDVQASERFHQKLAGKLQAATPDSLGEILAACFRGTLLNWRVALPAIAVLVAVGVTVATRRQPPDVSSSPRAGIQTAPVSGAHDDLAPTIANYHRVANQSLDKLDALLTRQGNRALPPMPIYTASTLALAKGPG